MAYATERIFLPLMKFQLPEIVDMHLPMEGIPQLCGRFNKETISWPCPQDNEFSMGNGSDDVAKFIIVVDDDVNVQDGSEVLWKVFN